MTMLIEPQSAILTILAEEHRLYGRLITVAEAKRDALLTADTDGLGTLVREMEGITVAIERLEDERMAQVRLLAGEDSTDATITALAPHFTGAALTRLEQLRGELRDAVARLRTVNDTNTALVRQALTFSDQWSRLIRAAMPATYAATGAVSTPQTVSRSWHV
jgi:flagellar biosynthesis/type III secretory pathway chaperone